MQKGIKKRTEDKPGDSRYLQLILLARNFGYLPYPPVPILAIPTQAKTGLEWAPHPKFRTKEEFVGDKMFGRRRFEMEINMRGLCPLIQVFDMDNSLHFYCELLGFEIVEKTAGGGWAWLRHGTA